MVSQQPDPTSDPTPEEIREAAIVLRGYLDHVVELSSPARHPNTPFRLISDQPRALQALEVLQRPGGWLSIPSA